MYNLYQIENNYFVLILEVPFNADEDLDVMIAYLTPDELCKDMYIVHHE